MYAMTIGVCCLLLLASLSVRETQAAGDTTIVSDRSTLPDELGLLDDRPTLIGNFVNCPQLWYGLVKLHKLSDTGIGIHTVTMRPKLARDPPTALNVLNRHTGHSHISESLFRFEYEEQLEQSDDKNIKYSMDAVAEADAVDAWYDLTLSEKHGATALRPPRISFHVSDGVVRKAVVIGGNDHMQPFTLLMANSRSGEIILNFSSVSHGMASGAVSASLDFKQCSKCLERTADFEILLHFHPRRLTVFESQFSIAQLGLDGNLVTLVPLNSTFGTHFLVRWHAGCLGVWVSRRPPIPDFALELLALLNNTEQRIVASVFNKVPPGGMGLSDALHESMHGTILTNSTMLTVRVLFSERPRERYARFEIPDVKELLGLTLSRPDGEVLHPTAVDRTPWRPQDPSLRLLLKKVNGSAFVSCEVLQHLPIVSVQLWVRNVHGETEFLDEEEYIDYSDHWRRDVPHFGWHHVIAANKLYPENRLQLDVLYNIAPAPVGPSELLLRWAEDHSANVSAVTITAAEATLEYPAGVLGGEVLRAASDMNATTNLLLVLHVPAELTIFAAYAMRVEWIATLLRSRSFVQFCAADDEDPAVAQFFGDASPHRSESFELLQLSLLFMSHADPPTPHGYRFQRLYRSWERIASRRWKPPLVLFNGSSVPPFLSLTFPFFVERYLEPEWRAWSAMHGFLRSYVPWLMEDAPRWQWSSRGGSGSSVRGWALPDFLALVSALRQSLVPPSVPQGQEEISDDGSLLLSSSSRIVPIVDFAPLVETPNAAVQIDPSSLDVSIVAIRPIPAGSPIFLAPARRTTLESLQVYGVVMMSAADAVDFPNGVLLRGDRKSSRDGLFREGCSEKAGSGYLACLEDLKAQLEQRMAALPHAIDRPPRTAALYSDRGNRLLQSTARCLAAARRAIRAHLVWVEDDISLLKMSMKKKDTTL